MRNDENRVKFGEHRGQAAERMSWKSATAASHCRPSYGVLLDPPPHGRPQVNGMESALASIISASYLHNDI